MTRLVAPRETRIGNNRKKLLFCGAQPSKSIFLIAIKNPQLRREAAPEIACLAVNHNDE
jgi:hypothetical protein